MLDEKVFVCVLEPPAPQETFSLEDTETDLVVPFENLMFTVPDQLETVAPNHPIWVEEDSLLESV